MKKKIVMFLLVGCLLTSLTGCGSEESRKGVSDEIETAAEKEDGDKDGREKDEEESKEEKDVSKEEESEEKEEKKSSDGPVLGGEDIEGYEGFEYLYEELLMTETEENKETGKKERKSLVVYIPDDEYARADGNYAYSNSMGVNFRVDLEPYLRYDADDYLPQENLDDYIANNYDPFYTAEYKDVVISEAKEVEDGAVAATVEYCRYDEWEEAYYTVFCTYYLAELENDETVLVTVEITDSEVTGKTEGLIAELEQFYQFDIDWDAQRAEQKRLAYAENETENTYSTGSLLFELPLGWEEDDDLSSYDSRIFAPGGDVLLSECMFAIGEEYLGYNERLDFDSVMESFSADDLGEAMGSSVVEQSAEICETNLGQAAKIVYTVDEGELVVYVVEGDGYVYTLMALQAENATDDAIAVLESVLENGQVR